MEIDKKTIKLLSSDTRVNILKSLSRRRKTLTELASEFDLAKSTITEHLSKLEESNLIIKQETGRKWIYYELSSKGEKLIKPKTPTPFVILLTLGIIIIIFGSMSLGIMDSGSSQFQSAETTAKPSIDGIVHEEVNQFNPLPISLVVLGLIVVVFSVYKIKKLKS
ncbi:MAG: winged helix-turn-helix domain-containing protein [Nanoarchaeota archaeon]|nr:winged helix-turn-helix domain-containing protein [Nanoarchaeota archaeon]